MDLNEKNLSTKQPAAQTHARISQPHEHSRRARHSQTTPRQGPQTVNRSDSTQTSASLKREGQRYAFPKSARVLTRREFLSLQQRGKRLYSQHFVVISTPASGKRSRLGITATRRFGKAVVRNRMKRILREFFRKCRARITPAQNILIIPKVGADALDFARVAEELERVLLSAGKGA
jgi:ribonuclease P protein component